MRRSTDWSKWGQNHLLLSQTGFQSAQNEQLGRQTGFLPKQVSQKHIFDRSQTLKRPYKGQKGAKIGPKGGPIQKIAYCEAKQDFKVSKIHCWDVKLFCYLKEATRQTLGAYKG